MANDSSTSSGKEDLVPFYEQLCKPGHEALRKKSVKISPYLEDLSKDTRRGLTLIVRPSTDVARAMEDILNNILAAAPDLLFCYDRHRFHFTILSLIDARDGFEPDELVVRAFEERIEAVARRFLPFDVEFRGICATENSIIAKGFPDGDALENLRNELRRTLKVVGLGGDIDRRYRIKGAHVTLARFRKIGDFNKLVKLLVQLRDKFLGRMSVTHAQLVCNDFYMSPEKVRTPAVFPKPFRVTHNLPEVFASFVGRSREIADVLHSLRRPGAHIITISGFGGIGKSELAKAAAWICVDAGWPFEFICWIDTRSYSDRNISLSYVLDHIARTADPKSYIPSIVKLDEKKRHIAAMLRARPSLLIIDNYEDLGRNRREENKVAQFIASFAEGDNDLVRILVTTRELQSLQEQNVERLELEKLPFADADKLMESLAQQGKGKKLDAGQRRLVWEIVYGVPKLIVLAMEQLRTVTFNDWFEMAQELTGKAEELGNALYGQSWDHLLSEDMKHILMALAHFVGEAKWKALRIVSGIERDAFIQELAPTPESYIENTGTGYTAHPLAMQFYRNKLRKTQASFLTSLGMRLIERLDHIYIMSWGRKLREKELSSLWTESGMRFITYFRTLVQEAASQQNFDVMEEEIRNIAAAVKLAESLPKYLPSEQGEQVRRELIQLQESVADFLWIHGWWQDYEEMAEIAGRAAERLNELHYVARFLCLELGWLALRQEEISLAEKRIRRGIRLCKELGEAESVALLTRHLAKAALLRGLDETFYEPGDKWEKWAKRAFELYNKSLEQRRILKEKENDQNEAISDLKLDLGRLYWLWGQHHQRKARETNEDKLLKEAYHQYERAYEISKEALKTHQEINCKRGVAKACGNCGNAAKQMATFLLEKEQRKQAKPWVNRAREIYTKSLEVAHSISRKDEIAHAYWGLAEVNLLYAMLAGDAAGGDRISCLLQIAGQFANASNELYQTLAGPRDGRSTERLCDTIRAAQHQAPDIVQQILRRYFHL